MTQTLARTLAFTCTLTSNATRLKANLDRKHHFMVQTTMLRRFNSVIKDQKRSLALTLTLIGYEGPEAIPAPGNTLGDADDSVPGFRVYPNPSPGLTTPTLMG